MRYTVSEKGNKKIKEDMNIICKEILERVKGVISIFLTGGFSRGEGPVKIEKGKAFPYNDYDIQVVSSFPVSKNKADEISIIISEKLGYRGIVNFYPFRKEEQQMKKNFYIDLKCDIPEELKKMLPRIRTYELKNHSKILYGKDLRSLIPNYSLKEIPLSEGAKLLLDRMSQMIEYYSTEGKYEKENLTYFIQQAYAAICTSLLLLSKKYEIGYLRSMEIFKETYEKDFPELHEKLPDLDKKIEQFVKWKINPIKLPDKDVEKEWFIAKRNIIEVSKYFFSRFLKKKIETIQELSDAILGMRKEFYLPYLKEIVKRKIKTSLGSFSALLLPFVSLVMKKNYRKRLKEMGIKHRLLLRKSPDLVIFSSLIYLISSIKERIVDEVELSKAKRLLSSVYPVKGSSWEEISLDYANAYIAFFLQKIQ